MQPFVGCHEAFHVFAWPRSLTSSPVRLPNCWWALQTTEISERRSCGELCWGNSAWRNCIITGANLGAAMLFCVCKRVGFLGKSPLFATRPLPSQYVSLYTPLQLEIVEMAPPRGNNHSWGRGLRSKGHSPYSALQGNGTETYTYILIYGTPPPMYPHFCEEDMLPDVQGGTIYIVWTIGDKSYFTHLYCLNYWGQVVLHTSEGQESFKKVLKVLKLLGTKN